MSPTATRLVPCATYRGDNLGFTKLDPYLRLLHPRRSTTIGIQDRQEPTIYFSRGIPEYPCGRTVRCLDGIPNGIGPYMRIRGCTTQTLHSEFHKWFSFSNPKITSIGFSQIIFNPVFPKSTYNSEEQGSTNIHAQRKCLPKYTHSWRDKDQCLQSPM